MNNIETMKLALEALEYMTKGTISGGNEKTKQAIKEMRQAIEQTEKQEPATVLPDGSAFSVMSWPLPKNHWLYAEREYRDGEYEPMELGKPILTHQLRDSVVSAVRYAVRGATNCGKEVDFDPDALVQNAVYALCGPYGQAIEQAQQADKEGSPCHEFWDWLPKAYNFEGDGNFTKYNMEVAFLAGKQAQYAEQMELPEPRLTGTFSIRAGKFKCTGCTGSWTNREDAKHHSCKDYQ